MQMGGGLFAGGFVLDEPPLAAGATATTSVGSAVSANNGPPSSTCSVGTEVTAVAPELPVTSGGAWQDGLEGTD